MKNATSATSLGFRVIDPQVIVRSLIVVLALTSLGAPSVAVAQDASPVEAASTESADSSADSWWTPWYLADYGIIAAGTTAFIVGEGMEPATPALFGPAYRADDPASLFDHPQLADVSKPYRAEGHGETVPKEWVIGAIGAATLSLGALEGYRWAHGTGSALQFHDTMVGFLESTALTAGVTNLIKPSVGRLRPDFGSRARHYFCTTGDLPDIDCEGYRYAPLSEDPDEAAHLLLDGQRSFVSGHSSNSFSVFTYTSLVIGGNYVWGDQATPTSRAAGIASQSVLMATASFIAASRVIDGRHHPTDVLAGAGIGLAFANFAYWRRFGLDGKSRGRDLEFGPQERVSVELGPSSHGAGLQLTVRHSGL